MFNFFNLYIVLTKTEKIYTNVCIATSLLYPQITLTDPAFDYFIDSIIYPKYIEKTKIEDIVKNVRKKSYLPKYYRFFDQYAIFLAYDMYKFVCKIINVKTDESLFDKYQKFIYTKLTHCYITKIYKLVNNNVYDPQRRIFINYIHSAENHREVKCIFNYVFTAMYDFVKYYDICASWKISYLISLHYFTKVAHDYFADIKHITILKGNEIISNDYNTIKMYYIGFVVYLQVKIYIRNTKHNLNSYYFTFSYDYVNKKDNIEEFKIGTDKIWKKRISCLNLYKK